MLAGGKIRSLSLGAARRVGSEQLRPFWTVVGIRVAYLAGTAVALLWSRTLVADGNERMRAWGPLSDLLFGTFAVWDAGWFVEIAQDGYATRQHTAFFPLYPLLVRGAAWGTGSEIVAGVLVSLVAAGGSALALAALSRPLLGPAGARTTVLLLAVFPTAFVFTSAFSEGVFLAFSASAFLAAQRRRGWLAGVLAAGAVGTRVIGLALVPSLVMMLWSGAPGARRLLRVLPVVVLPFGALGVYATYLWARFEDPLAFSAAQAYWHRITPDFGPATGLWLALRLSGRGLEHLVSDLPRTGERFAYADAVALWQVSHALLLLGAIWLTYVAWRRLGAAYGVYSAGALLLVLSTPVNWFPLQSLPRHLLVNFPLLLALAALVRDRPAARRRLLFSLGVLGGGAGLLAAQGTWVA
jgi:hypothetical protein